MSGARPDVGLVSVGVRRGNAKRVRASQAPFGSAGFNPAALGDRMSATQGASPGSSIHCLN